MQGIPRGLSNPDPKALKSTVLPEVCHLGRVFLPLSFPFAPAYRFLTQLYVYVFRPRSARASPALLSRTRLRDPDPYSGAGHPGHHGPQGSHRRRSDRNR